MSARRCALLLLVLGGLLLLLTRQPWVVASAPDTLRGSTTVSASGAELSAWPVALAWTAVAAALAVLIGGATTRRLVGLLLVGLAAATVADVGRLVSDPATAPRWAEAVLGTDQVDLARRLPLVIGCLALAVVVLLLGSVLVQRSGRWPAGLGQRFERPTTPTATAEEDPTQWWRAQDRGEDPTR